ncbi:hypothetical protein AX15_004724 [Amanita polypyramis BW_CC]|nr:hypothetical protein AX15_004724 [Amanita polypyramis BW_CC]
MSAEPFFSDDKLETLVLNCVILPADGSRPRIAPMTVRTVTTDDIASLTSFNRCVDMTGVFGDEYGKTQVVAHKTVRQGRRHAPSIYLFFYNLSPKLPINLSIAHVTGVTSNQLQAEKRTFYTGDIVVMKVQIQSEEISCFVKGLDADLSELRVLENFLRGRYRRGELKRVSEPECEKAISMKFSTEDRKVTRSFELPPRLERRIFETCALEYPETRTTLVLLAKRVHAWIDPILISTVIINVDGRGSDQLLQRFLSKLTNGKPAEYYARHVKNLTILGHLYHEVADMVNNVLAICSGVERLRLEPFFASADLRIPQVAHNLRRLTIKLGSLQYETTPSFHRPYFANLTHLHLWDPYWSNFPGWENLTSLTHLAFVYTGTRKRVAHLMKTLPGIQYVAIGSYDEDQYKKYTGAVVNNNPPFGTAWGVRVVFLSELPTDDWERGVKGQGDFWDVVEQEVERRLAEGSAA